MAPRAQWKGFLRVGEVSCAVSLYTAATTSERISLHILNRDTGNRVRREYVDVETGKPVDRDDQVKGFETDSGDYIVLEPEEIAAAVPESDKTLDIEAFIPCADIDDVYFDKPYYLGPSDKSGSDAFAILRDGMEGAKVAAIARTVLFRRVRTVLIRPHGRGLIATTLNFDYEVRSAREAFDDVPELRIKGEMLDLAKHIINTKKGKFDATEVEDRYEEALAELIKAKLEGRPLPKPKAPEVVKSSDLLEALRLSAGGGAEDKPKKRAATGKAKRSGAKQTAARKRSAEPARRAS
jgi:DNA end-binding protein Ku